MRKRTDMPKGSNPKSRANLRRPIQKGEVLNPKGASPGPTYKGILTKLGKGLITVEEAGKLKKLTRQEIACLQLFKDALDGRNTAAERTRAIQTIMDRLEGKPVQPLSTTSPTDIALIISSSENRL
jgi:hypothetical protein